MSYAYEVIADDTGKWYGNAVRFATGEEADKAASNKMWNWLAVREVRVVESTDPVNYRWVDGKGLEPCTGIT